MFIAVVILVVVIVLSSFVYLNFQKPYAGKLESINVSYAPFESLTLFWVAQEQDFFSQNGLNVTSHKYDTGTAALNGVLNGEDDIVVGTSEFPFTASALNGNRISTIASISKSEFIYLVGRVDRGIHVVSDLKGKTIVTNTTTEDNIALLKERGVKTVITTTPRYDGRSFGTNLTEAMLTAYTGKGRRLSDDELNGLIDELDLRPEVMNF